MLKPSNIQFKTLFAVYTTIDAYGRHGRLVGYYETLGAATDAAEGRGARGANGVIEEVPAIVIDGKTYHLAVDWEIEIGEGEAYMKARRKQALEKLDGYERRILGL